MKFCEHNDYDPAAIKKHKTGVSSYAMQDPEFVFQELQLKNGNSFLDLGCGAGDYSIRASKEVGENGIVYALDKWSEVTAKFTEKINSQGIKNIKVITTDILCPLAIDKDSIDVCLLATVLHIPNIVRKAGELFNNIKHVLINGGILAVIEIKKEKTELGPPYEMRLSPEDTSGIIRPYSYKIIKQIDLGHNYMLLFQIEK